MDFYVVMGRPGNRVTRRRHAGAHVGVSHRIKKEETLKWFQTTVRGPASLVVYLNADPVPFLVRRHCA